MTFDDRGELEIENYEYAIDGITYYLFLRVSYEVRCTVLTHDHNMPVGEDYPDGYECTCIDVTIDDYEVWNDENIVDIVLNPSQVSEIASDLYEMAVEHYAEFGSWGE